MFGYITIDPKTLDEALALRYRGFYCGLCRSLTRRYGRAAQMTLSNDMTFMAMLLASLYEPTETSYEIRCALHPFKKRQYTSSAAINYAADMNLLLAWYKCMDDQADEPSPRSRAAECLLRKSYEKVKSAYPEKDRIIRETLSQLSELEKTGSTDLDALSMLSGQMLGEIFVWKQDAFAPLLYRIGFSLGCFVYLMDAFEDYDEDLRKKRFNPLTQVHAQSDYPDYIRDLLTLMVADSTLAFNLLPLEQDMDILQHILYCGIWSRYHYLTSPDRKEKKKT